MSRRPGRRPAWWRATYNQPMRTLAGSMLVVLTLAACGLKGDLYLPPPGEQPAATPQPVDEEEAKPGEGR